MDKKEDKLTKEQAQEVIEDLKKQQEQYLENESKGFDYVARDKVSDAICSFFDHYRYYYYMLTSMARIEDRRSCPSMGVGFIRGNIPALFYNPDWIKERSHEEMMVTLDHECQHIGLKHLQRLGNRDRMISNVAMDVVVNSNIPNLDKLPKFKEMLVTQDKFKELKKANIRDLTWEDIYDLIKPEIDKKREEFQKMLDEIAETHDGWTRGGGKQEKTCGACKGTGKDGNGEECKECNGTGKKESQGAEGELTPAQQAALKGLMKESAEKLGGRDPGNIPGSMRRTIDRLLKPRFNWKQQLSLFAQSMAKEDKQSSWKRYNRRFGVISPGRKKEYKPSLLGVIDNSGSVDKKTYDVFVSHMCKIADVCDSLDGIGVDTRVNFEFEFKRGQTPAHDDSKSGGGTSFQPAFDYAKKSGKNYDGIIYFTDGFGDNHLKTYDIPVLFVICPYGTDIEGFRNIKIEIDDDENY